ncbi:DUF5590 domain-containing protein [Oceanobacillus senegalensis]|uniref:cell wall elongation regulator TseB-like domain-containing protein n=1 Tax=Oceanobacillus senegalensis TaxID=1936063 RepID=UPI001FEC9F2E|nr:DUF5590 domain-containing protein [Oceanobacillus senegalensis]
MISLIYGTYLYKNIYDKKTDGFEQTEKIILEQTSITEIDDIDLFYGNEAYHIVVGKNEENEEKMIFYPLEGKEKKITTVDTSEIIPKEDIINTWEKNCEGCTLVKITPALIDDNILWELSYHDAKSRYVLEYVSIYNGSSFEQYRFERMFN